MAERGDARSLSHLGATRLMAALYLVRILLSDGCFLRSRLGKTVLWERIRVVAGRDHEKSQSATPRARANAATGECDANGDEASNCIPCGGMETKAKAQNYKASDRNATCHDNLERQEIECGAGYSNRKSGDDNQIDGTENRGQRECFGRQQHVESDHCCPEFHGEKHSLFGTGAHSCKTRMPNSEGEHPHTHRH
jgi:hypothetical protein